MGKDGDGCRAFPIFSNCGFDRGYVCNQEDAGKQMKERQLILFLMDLTNHFFQNFGVLSEE